MFRLLQVSDPHLSPDRAYGLHNFDQVARSLAWSRPDLVVATGDLNLDDPDDEACRRWVRGRFDAIPVSWRALPGNHDIGDTQPDPYLGEEVTNARRQAWLDVWGPDWWAVDADEWVVIGLDSLLFGSGLPADGEQFEWLAAVVAAAGRRPIALLLHKPLCLWDLDETEVSQMAVTPEGRRRLRDALGGAHVRLVASGHVHQYRSWASEGLTMVWAPSTAFVSRRGEPSKYDGTKVVGAVDYRFAGRGVTWRLVRPPGMVDQDVADLAAGAESLRAAPLLAAN